MAKKPTRKLTLTIDLTEDWQRSAVGAVAAEETFAAHLAAQVRAAVAGDSVENYVDLNGTTLVRALLVVREGTVKTKGEARHQNVDIVKQLAKAATRHAQAEGGAPLLLAADADVNPSHAAKVHADAVKRHVAETAMCAKSNDRVGALGAVAEAGCQLAALGAVSGAFAELKRQVLAEKAELNTASEAVI